MTSTAIRAALSIVCLLLVAPARAEEPETARGLGLRAASFEAPAKERGFAFDMEVFAGGTVVGEARFEAEAEPLPGAKDPALHWHVRETIAVGEGEDAARTHLDAWLSRDLQPVRGRLVEGTGADPLVHAFRLVGDAFEVEVTGDGREARRKRAKREGYALVGVTSYLLLAREIADAKHAHAGHALAFAPDWEYLVAGRPFTPVSIEATPGRWRDREVRRLRAIWPDEEGQLTAILDPRVRSLLYLHLQPPSQPAFDLRPKEAGTPDNDDVLDVPAKTPLAAAMRTTLAFTTANVDLFEEVVHWGKLQEHGKAYVRGKVTPAEFKKAILAQFRKNAPPPMPTNVARKEILDAKASFEVEMEGETRAVVTLPAAISPMRLTVERVDGVWYLVRLPHG